MNYQEYLCSRAWGLKREAVRKRAEGYCEFCKWREGRAVHHKTYEHLYNEPLEDLIFYCEVCHAFQHGREETIDIGEVRAEASSVLEDCGTIPIPDKMQIYVIADARDPKWRAQAFSGEDPIKQLYIDILRKLGYELTADEGTTIWFDKAGTKSGTASGTV